MKPLKRVSCSVVLIKNVLMLGIRNFRKAVRPAYGRLIPVLSFIGSISIWVCVVIRRRCHVTNFTLCLMGAALGLGAGFFILRHFVFNPGLPVYSDLVWVYSSDLYPLHYTWDEFRQYPQIVNHMLGYLTVSMFPAETSVRALYLLLFTFMGISMFFATYKLTAPRHPSPRVPLIAAILGTLFFVLSPVVAQFMCHWYRLWFWAFMPLLLYFSYTGFRDVLSYTKADMLKRSIIIALVLSLTSVDVRMPYVFPLLMVAFLAGFARPYWNYLKCSIILMGLTVIFYMVFSAVWLIPTLLTSSGVPDFYVVSRGHLDTLTRDASLYTTFNLEASWTSHPKYHVYPLTDSLVPYWKASLLAIPVLAFGALVFRRNKLLIWLAAFALMFIFLGKGTNPPFGGFYEWLSFDAPLSSYYGWQFRRPQTWMIPLAFCYCTMIGFFISYSLGGIRNRISSKWISRPLFIVAIIVFILAPLFPGYPLLTGDLSGKMQQKRSHYASDFVALDSWMKEEGSDTKIFYYPGPWHFGSPRPTMPQGPRLEPSHFLLGYRFLLNSIPDTMNMGKLIAPWNAKYLAFRSRYLDGDTRALIYDALSQQEDLELIEEFVPYKLAGDEYYHIYLYENRADYSQISACSHSVGVVGGLENMISLALIDSYDMVNSPIIFLDQRLDSRDYLSTSDILVSNLGALDLYMTQLDERYMVIPFEFVDDNPQTKWKKASVKPRQSAEWHFYLKQRDIFNYQYDFDVGLVWQSGPTEIEMPFNVPDSGEYHILARYLRNVNAVGGIRVSVDDAFSIDIPASSSVNEFVWEKVGSFVMEKGAHSLKLENIRGFEAVNLLAVVPHAELERYEAQVDGLLEGKQLVSIWEAETALNYSNAEKVAVGVNASNGDVLKLASNGSAWRDIDILRGGDYRVAVRLNGGVVLTIGGQNYAVNSDGLDFVYLDSIALDKGEYKLEATPISGTPELDAIWLYSVEAGDESLEDIFALTGDSPRLIEINKVDPTKYRAEVSASGPFMLAFAEAYDPFWRASVNGREYHSVPLNSDVNGFWIEDEGDLKITIEYKPQVWFYYGAAISGIGIIGAFIFLILAWKRKRR